MRWVNAPRPQSEPRRPICPEIECFSLASGFRLLIHIIVIARPAQLRQDALPSAADGKCSRRIACNNPWVLPAVRKPICSSRPVSTSGVGNEPHRRVPSCRPNDLRPPQGRPFGGNVHSLDTQRAGRGQCCTADTPLRSLPKVSRSRQTTDQHHCFVASWSTLILRKASARRWPRRTSPHPSVRLGPRGYFRRNSPVPC